MVPAEDKFTEFIKTAVGRYNALEDKLYDAEAEDLLKASTAAATALGSCTNSVQGLIMLFIIEEAIKDYYQQSTDIASDPIELRKLITEASLAFKNAGINN